MDIKVDNAVKHATMPTKEVQLALEEDQENLTVQMVAEIAAAAHRSGGATTTTSDEDRLAELEDSLHRTSISGSHSSMKRPSLRRKSSASSKLGYTRPGIRRAQSMRVNVPQQKSMRQSGISRGVGLNRTKSTDLSYMPAMLSSSSSSSQAPPPGPGRRQVPQRSSSMLGARRPPSRSSSGADTLRVLRRDQQINTSIGRQESNRSLLRGRSGTCADDSSVGTFSDMDSCFTMDSINIRKSQLIADPLDNATYHEDDSYACHDDTSASHFSEYRALGGLDQSVTTFCTFDSLKLRPTNINEVLNQACDVSCLDTHSSSTLNSADLTDLDSVLGAPDDGLFELSEAGESQLIQFNDSDEEEPELE